MYRFVTLLLLLALAAPAALAQTPEDADGRWGVQVEAGYWKLVEGYWDHSNVDNFLGLSLRRGLSPRWTAELGYRFGRVRPGVEGPAEDAGVTLDGFGPLQTEIHNPTLNIQYHFAPQSRFGPFLGLGIGATAWRVMDVGEDAGLFDSGTTVQGFGNDDDSYQALQRTDVTIATELGVEWWLAESFSLRLGGRYHILPGNDLDNVGFSSANLTGSPDYVDANKGHVQGFLGVTWWFGGSQDADGDGLPDDEDRCPRNPEDYDGFEDQDGCPDYDNDEDGVADLDDGCPEDPEDRDGFQDQDGCPDPDNDGDGILDADDACPDQAEDRDGFEDQDGCPDPDNDGDGVLDEADECPDTEAGVAVDDRGCALPEPEPDPQVQAISEGLVLEGVNFRSGSAQLTAESIGKLSEVAASLEANPEVRVEVRGHTDATGSAETNRDLSQRRAMAVRDVLIQLGIAPSRVTAVGYGEDYPVAPNDTAAGRAKNRRVELQRIE
jgi:outer membrane protein OmpA-like peptidoglycan-associated protein/opacity protein-like surface antigen